MLLTKQQKQILSLLADGRLHDKEELSSALDSQTDIFSYIRHISEQLGLQISAVEDIGYQLNSPLELLNQKKITAHLNYKSLSLISSLEIYEQINSTNSYLVERAQHNALSGSVCFAESQTAGRGRLGRQWLSPFGTNIYLSILWHYHQTAPVAISGLSLAVGVAVIRALKAHFPTMELEIGLKWPNDLYSRGKKLGGILIEASTTTDSSCIAVIGLGLNLFLPEAHADSITQPWTDLTQITGQKILHRNKLASLLLNHLLPVIADFANDGIKSYVNEWCQYDCMTGKHARLFHAKQTITGFIEGIDDNGLLLLKLADGRIQAFASGEVSFSE